jgi:hypothetical protein
MNKVFHFKDGKRIATCCDSQGWRCASEEIKSLCNSIFQSDNFDDSEMDDTNDNYFIFVAYDRLTDHNAEVTRSDDGTFYTIAMPSNVTIPEGNKWKIKSNY